MSEFFQKLKDVKILWYFLKPHKVRVVFVAVTMVVAGLLESLNLAAIYPIINYGLELKDTNVSLLFLNKLIRLIPSENLFLASCVMLILFTVVATAFRIFHHYLANRLVREVAFRNQTAIFDKLRSADYPFFVRNQQGRLVYAATIAPQGVSNNMFYLVRITNGLVNVILFSALLVVLSWKGTILVAAVALAYVLFVKRITTDLVNRSARKAVEEDRRKNVILNEFITGVKSIKVFLSDGFWRKKFFEAADQSTYFNFKVNMGRILPDSFVKFAFYSIFAMVGILFSIGEQGNIINIIPLLATFTAVAGRLFPYMNVVGNDIVSIARFLPDTRIVYELLEERMDYSPSGSKEVQPFSKEIAFQNVWFKYEGTEDFLLKDASFTIEKRKITAIVGSSGAGKSTLINLLLRLYDVSIGAISMDEVDIRQLRYRDYLSQIGYVSQETFIFNGTIDENIRFGADTYDDSAVLRAAQLANAEEFIVNCENGFNTIVGDSGVKLSGGQRQRIAIARAMLRKPQILVLDEATSSLDNISEKAVQEAINRIAEHTTVLIVAHRLSTIQKADKIIVLEEGKIIEEGTHQELFEKKSAYYQLYTS